MALVRILVDGYSLLHAWRELAPGQPRFSEAAREELIRQLALYQDTLETPITIVFDGRGTGRGGKPPKSKGPQLEILYSTAGQTADQVIERAANLFAPYGEVLVVTDDQAERETVMSLGGLASSCLNFIQTVGNALADVADTIKDLNRRERHRFQRRRTEHNHDSSRRKH